MKECCTLSIFFGFESTLYSFPSGHPLNSSRTELFSSSIRKLAASSRNVSIVKPVAAKEEDLLLFHTQEYIDFVKESSKLGEGYYLDYGDTPSFKGVYEASLFPVGSSLEGLSQIEEGRFDHSFNPVGGLHHARRERAGGFCVFNDASIVISKALKKKYSTVAYVDIDAHHGDGVFYGYESDRRVIIGDVHEDGRFLYPGTGFSNEKGKGKAEGTKLNVPLLPGAKDIDFMQAFDKVYDYIASFKPEFIFFQCGADGLDGDPITHLAYTSKAHAYACSKLHALSHEVCDGRILAMGGGGYNPKNVNEAWTSISKSLLESEA